MRRAIGGGGSVPSLIARRWSMPARARPSAAMATGSSHSNVRVRCIACPARYRTKLHDATYGLCLRLQRAEPYVRQSELLGRADVGDDRRALDAADPPRRLPRRP